MDNFNLERTLITQHCSLLMPNVPVAWLHDPPLSSGNLEKTIYSQKIPRNPFTQESRSFRVHGKSLYLIYTSCASGLTQSFYHFDRYSKNSRLSSLKG
jgi:hypothetical protein